MLMIRGEAEIHRADNRRVHEWWTMGSVSRATRRSQTALSRSSSVDWRFPDVISCLAGEMTAAAARDLIGRRVHNKALGRRQHIPVPVQPLGIARLQNYWIELLGKVPIILINYCFVQSTLFIFRNLKDMSFPLLCSVPPFFYHCSTPVFSHSTSTPDFISDRRRLINNGNCTWMWEWGRCEHWVKPNELNRRQNIKKWSLL